LIVVGENTNKGEKLPVKVYDGLPLMVRFYGSLTTHQREELIPFIEKLSQYDSILIDMMNFQGMGTLLYECFKPLNKVKNLNFVANEEEKRHLIAMGFMVHDS
jgi:predicted aldo/keto reductase-like oxidoreductase